MDEFITTLKFIHRRIKPEIEKRLKEFKRNRTEEKMEKEFFFCLLTPQCKARICWTNIEALYSKGILQKGTEKEIAEYLYGIRFRNNKARYIVEAREKFFNGRGSIKKVIDNSNDPLFLRQYIVKNVKGMGWKEASHFLRNTGMGEELAILDRHILRGLLKAKVIKKIPETLTGKTYIAIEDKMRKFAESIDIPLAHLDFVLWYFFNREVFK
ncbi:MAG TPA: N-glycosylase/DNA lyase [bacterium]|nr:N-glycosylase/DNA lyase [bacterium]HPP30416.1 N-glycosylase/DNA lyase [bacterium]